MGFSRKKKLANTIYCETASDYLKELSLCNSSWWDDNIKCSWIFRGQQANHQLLPTLYRKNNSNKLIYQEIFEKIQRHLVDNNPHLDVEGIVNGMDYVLKEKKPFIVELIKSNFVELELTEQFLLRCNEVGLQTPALQLFINQHPDLSAAQYFHYQLARDLIKNFIHDLKQFEIPLRAGFRSLLHSNYPEAMALARHHSVPSKLLDWTKEPLIAAFFLH
jgi:hypothetical protein